MPTPRPAPRSTRRGRAGRVVALPLAWAALLTLTGGAPAHAQDAPARVLTAARAPGATADLYLDVTLNGAPLHLIAHFIERDGRLLASPADLRDLGIAASNAPTANPARVALDTLPGVTYRYDVTRQTVDLRVPDALLTPHRLDTRALPPTPPATAGRGFVLNYDLYAQSTEHTPISLWSEARYFDPTGVFSTTGVASFYRDQHRYLRYDTSWSRSDPNTLTTTQLGDTISTSLAWTRSLRIGGVQWRSNFALRPDLVTFPVPALPGSAVVPTSVDVYVNSVRQFSGDVPSGPFVINSVPGITGAGSATVVTRDALGRTIATSLPLYIDTRLLAPGLAAYSVEAGFLRRAYGLSSFDYDPRAAASATARYGVSDALTVEAHAEATGGLYNAGAGAFARLGMAGVVSASLAGSAGRLAGTQVGLGYQLISPRFSIDAQTLRTAGRYGDLAARDGTPVPTVSDRVTLTLPFIRAQSLALNYIGLRYPGAPPSQIGSIAYSLSLGGLASLTVNAFQDFRRHGTRGAFVSLNVGLGHNVSLNANVGRQSGETIYSVNANRPPDYDGGAGWAVQAGHAGDLRYAQAQAQYLGRAGQVTALAQTIGGQRAASLDVTGALVLMDGRALLSRRIDDGFALVSTDATPGVPVLHENRPIGATDRSGHFLIPDLNAYQNNRIGIDSMTLPIDTRLSDTVQNVVPQARSGVLAHFSITREAAASVLLRDAAGAPLPAGLRVRQVETGGTTIVGYDGLTFVTDLGPLNHLEIDGGGRRCGVAFPYVHPADGTLPTIGPLTCDLK